MLGDVLMLQLFWIQLFDGLNKNIHLGTILTKEQQNFFQTVYQSTIINLANLKK